MPRFHVTLTIPIKGRRQGIRVLITELGIAEELVRFLSVPRNAGKSASWQTKVVAAVGQLFDYMVAVPPSNDDLRSDFGPARLSLDTRSTYLSRFVEAMRGGTIDHRGNDPSKLFWPASGRNRTSRTIRLITAYSDFCANAIGVSPLNPIVPASFSERLVALRAADHRNSKSLFAHLGASGEGNKYPRSINSNPVNHVTARGVVAEPLHARRQLAPPFFPFGKSEQLLFESGFRVQKDGLFWEQYNLRDYLIAFLCRYGGLRASEPHHLFVNDVRVRYDDVGRPSAEVLLYHPTDSQITYMDPVTKRLATVTREEYLKRRFSMRARNMMTDRLHAGWKDLLLDNAELYARVQWFPSEAGAVFWKTWRRYLDHVRRPQQPSHPWAFCAASGSPSTTVQFGRAFERAVGRIKLIAKKELGTTPHGLRHAYGQSLRKANVPRKIIQLAMHHRNPFSQDVYTEPSIVEVNATLNDATIRLHLASYGLGGSAWESRA